MVFAVNISLHRTFSVFRHSGEMSEEVSDYQLWLFRRNNSGLSWSDLLKKRVVVILGEMGIGKTFEFQNQAICLQQEDKRAFFLPLDQINSQESFRAALDEQAPRFEKWLGSNDMGYFFLDAVDEARLKGPPALQTALRAIRDVLQQHLQRVSFFISSRITDWSVPGIQQTVEQILLKPICDAEVPKLLQHRLIPTPWRSEATRLRRLSSSRFTTSTRSLSQMQSVLQKLTVQSQLRLFGWQ